MVRGLKGRYKPGNRLGMRLGGYLMRYNDYPQEEYLLETREQPPEGAERRQKAVLWQRK
jgi:hypothetical protein